MVRTETEFEKAELREALRKVGEKTRREIEEAEHRCETSEAWRDQDTGELEVRFPASDQAPGAAPPEPEPPRGDKPGNPLPDSAKDGEPSDLKSERVQ